MLSNRGYSVAKFDNRFCSFLVDSGYKPRCKTIALLNLNKLLFFTICYLQNLLDKPSAWADKNCLICYEYPGFSKELGLSQNSQTFKSKGLVTDNFPLLFITYYLQGYSWFDMLLPHFWHHHHFDATTLVMPASVDMATATKKKQGISTSLFHLFSTITCPVTILSAFLTIGRSVFFIPFHDFLLMFFADF